MMLLSATLIRRTLPYLISFIFLSILFCLYIHFFYPRLFFLDDPYIVLHSAQVLHSGYDWRYIGTPALAGNTSPVHLLLTYLLLFFFSPLYALVLANWLGVFAYVFGLITLSRLYRCTYWQTAMIIFCGLFSGMFMAQLLNGLETSLAIAAMVWVLVLASTPLTTCHRCYLAILLGSLPFIRPELIAFSLSIYLFQLYRYKQNDYWRVKNILQDLTLMFLAAAPWLIWSWHTTHHFYPQSIVAKPAFFAKNYSDILSRWYLFSCGLLQFFLAISLFYSASFYLLSKTKLGWAVLLFIFIFCITYFCTEPSILLQNNDRYLYLWMPLLLFGFIITAHSPTYFPKLLLLFITIINLCDLPAQTIHHQKLSNAMGKLLEQYTTWANTHLPQHEVIAIQDAGYISYATTLTLTDFVGLKSEENITLHQQYTKPSHGILRAQAIGIILKNTRAHYLIMTNEWASNLHIPEQLNTLGFQVRLIKTIAVPSPDDPAAAYMVYRIQY